MMLQINETGAPAFDGVGDQRELEHASIVDIGVLFLRRRYVLILCSVVLALAAGVLYLKFAPPKYVAVASISVDNRESTFVQQQTAWSDATVDVDSQITFLKSDVVAATVVRQLHLDADSEFVGPDNGLFSTLRRLWMLPAAFGSDDGPLNALRGLWTSSPAPGESERFRMATSAIERNTTVTRVGTGSVLEISFTSRSPDKAARIADAIADAFISNQIDLKSQMHRKGDEWLLDRASELRSQAEAAEQAVVTFKNKNNIVAVDGKSLNEQALVEASAQLVAAQQKTADLKARYERAQALLKNSSSGTVDIMAVTASSDLTANATIAKSRQKFADMNDQVTDMSRKYGSDYWAVNNLRTKMQDTVRSIQDEIRRSVEGYKSDYDLSLQSQLRLEDNLKNAVALSGGANVTQVKLRELEGTAQSLRALAENYLQRATASQQTESIPFAEGGRVIARAVPPQERSSPKKAPIILAIAGFGGIALGIGLGFLRELGDRTFRTVGQVEERLRLPCVALVPRAIEPNANRPKLHVAAIAPDVDRTILRDKHLFWKAATQPNSRFTEGICSIKLALDVDVSKTGRKRILGLTSALPNEGKSTVTAALALLAARSGARTVLVDLDLRNPVLSRTLAFGAKSGVVDIIYNRCTLEEVKWADQISGLTFLPGSIKSPGGHSGALLASTQMKDLIEELHRQYDYVIVDLPPLIPIMDVRATATFISNYFMVIEWGKTQVDVVERALRSANDVRESVLGVVLNKVEIKKMHKYDVYSNSYYTNADFSRYGYTE